MAAVGNRDEALRWFDQAERDLKVARDNRAAGNFEWAAFLSQQAGEKALKAVLWARGRRPIHTHSAVDLVREAAADHAAVAALEDDAKELDRHYVASRYPNSYSTGAPYQYYADGDAARCIEAAGRVLKTCRETLRI